MNPEITDQTLVLQRLKEGDEKTFELLFHRYYAALCFFANKILKDEEAARDVVQEVFIRFYEKSYDFPNLIALKSFLYSCVQSKALNALEKQNTRTFLKQRLDTPKYEEATYFRHQIEAEIFEEISITIGFSPLKKNSTAITITISPINRIITLLPVSPSILIIREELLKIRYTKVITTATAMTIIILVSQSVALFHITIALVIAPGPHNIGIDKGVIEISLT